MLGFPKLKGLADQVVEWNLIARDEHPSVKQQEAIVREELEELRQATEDNDIKEQLDAIADIFFTAVYLEYLDPESNLVKDSAKELTFAIARFGLPLIGEVIQEVIESNYTKFLVHSGDSETYPCWVPEEVRDDIEKTLSIEGVTFKSRPIPNSDKRVWVFYNSNNKVMKPRHNYCPPKIEVIMNNNSLGVVV